MNMAEEQLEMRKLAESIAKEISVMATESKWATRFVWAAIFQGALVSLLTLFLVLGEVGFLHPSVSLLINTTVPGIWIALGYFAYLIVGVVGMAVTALFYQYLEVNLKSPYTGGAKSLAWIHLILSNVGIIGATVLIIYAGYVTGVATLPTSLGGLGMTMGDVEGMVLRQFLLPIAAFVSLTILGIMLGGLGYVIVYKARPKAQF
jgi:hypothetical protein